MMSRRHETVALVAVIALVLPAAISIGHETGSAPALPDTRRFEHAVESTRNEDTAAALESLPALWNAVASNWKATHAPAHRERAAQWISLVELAVRRMRTESQPERLRALVLEGRAYAWLALAEIKLGQARPPGPLLPAAPWMLLAAAAICSVLLWNRFSAQPRTAAIPAHPVPDAHARPNPPVVAASSGQPPTARSLRIEELRKESGLLQTVIERAPFPVLIFDSHGRLAWAPAAWCANVPAPLQPPVGRHYCDFLIDPADVALARQEFTDTGATAFRDHVTERWLTAADSPPGQVSWSRRLVRGRSGDIEYVVMYQNPGDTGPGAEGDPGTAQLALARVADLARSVLDQLTLVNGYTDLLAGSISDSSLASDLAEIRRAGATAEILSSEALMVASPVPVRAEMVGIGAALQSLQPDLSAIFELPVPVENAADQAVLRIDPTDLRRLLLGLIIEVSQSGSHPRLIASSEQWEGTSGVAVTISTVDPAKGTGTLGRWSGNGPEWLRGAALTIERYGGFLEYTDELPRPQTIRATLPAWDPQHV